MAVKKSTAPKAGAAKTAKAKPAAKKAAPKAKAPKAGAKKAAPKAKAPKAGAKKAAPKKAAIKLTEPQQKLLAEVASKGEGGLVSNKGNLKQLTALQGKKLVKKGKKSPEGVLYHITKLGQKHSSPAPAPEGTAASS